MKRFRFSLDKVRKVRRHQERAARQALAAEVSRMAALEGQRQRVLENLQSCEGVSPLEPGVTLARALGWGLKANAQYLQRDIDQQAKRLHAVQAEYAECRRNLKALDTLYERRFADWEAEMRAEEQAEFDEMARVRFVAQREEESRS